MDAARLRPTLVALPSVFVGSSTESRDIAEVVVSVLGSTYGCRGWWDVFPPSSFTLEALQQAARQDRFSVFVARGEDLLACRDDIKTVVRENVLCEFLMFLGANGRARTYLLVDVSAKPSLPSDLDGLVYVTFDGARFYSDPSGTLMGPCDELARAIASAHSDDLAWARTIERKAMVAQVTCDLLELADTAFLMRDIVDAVQRDTLEALVDESKFETVKQAALTRIDEVARRSEEKSVRASVVTEFAALKKAILGTVARLPFPKDVFAGLDEARSAYSKSILGAMMGLADALEARRWDQALQIAQSLRGRASHDAVAEEVAGIVDERLTRLKRSYAKWWEENSREMRRALSEFQRAIVKTQSENVFELVQAEGERRAHVPRLEE